MSIDIELLSKELKLDEGFRGKAYTCTAGKITVGYGHNIQDNPLPVSIADSLLNYDMAQSIKDCERLDFFGDLSGTRKRVIINMMFNIGMTKFIQFKKMIAAIRKADYLTASAEMKDSAWYRQVGDRSKRLVYMMRYDRTL